MARKTLDARLLRLPIFDDFFNRNYYKEAHKFFYIKKYNNFGILVGIKNNINNIENYILKYSLDPR